ncbi:GNAT family N-acetyltransferase [Citrobacter amalonaticus]|uniref:Protein ElaA n=1 Tax=Citrobacter amalonaticus TaxID=35703 RepID=A0AAW9M3D7_CITAM|nr:MULTISPECIES: GNAT family N-acetyltransferase [Citrobacter]MDU1756841.1 GNAT family N-acetyltransferase [Citrobacter sp.]ELR9581613.1 GNAT family N-acetyltransferase [Citrobacter amalonaticus]MDV2137251.1 GNAT family N-acetyltransferase [Citrobacter amalonaticus]MEB0584757.1 GNAT family N-acetyltransferase [Citrobacter amalonaticus]QIO40630.1 GNAT family N-acetyltransferase [Citrobacter sp. Y3]
MITWQDLHHSELTVPQLYALLKLRCAVFVVEQNCPYLDVDGDDLVGENRHILGWHDGELVAYARILKSTEDLEPVVIGRVIVSEALRGEKLGQNLMAQTLASCQRHWPEKSLYLGAQAHLQAFYARFGFAPVTEVYEEDGIPHVGMAREAIRAGS